MIFNEPPAESTYILESGYPEDTTTINARFKTSAVVGRQAYIGNIAKETKQKIFKSGLGYMDENEVITTDSTNKK